MRKTVIISPLNWGLGHASRIVPLISQLLDNEFRVVVAAEKKQSELLRTEFPELTYIQLHNPEIRYSAGKNQTWKIFLQIPKFIIGIVREHQFLKRYLSDNQVDIVISDNRYGFFSKRLPSVFITHQLSPKLPKNMRIFERLAARVLRVFINRYDVCLIPDFSGTPNLSGTLSHQKIMPKKFAFIGILSRFKKPEIEFQPKKYDILAVLSGPEPQRSIFEELLMNQLKNKKFSTLIVRGNPTKNSEETLGTLKLVSHLSAEQLQTAVNQSKNVIMRAGYSSIMDFAKIGKPAIIVPTPGQTEQEYLAEYLKDSMQFVSIKQSDFKIEDALKKLSEIKMQHVEFQSEIDASFIQIIRQILASAE